MNTFHIEEMGTTPFRCDNCGEQGWESRYWLEDGWDNLHPSIEAICFDCFTKENA